MTDIDKILDEKIDEILGHLLGQSIVEVINNRKGKQILMPAEKLYEYQIKAKEAIKQLIEEEVEEGIEEAIWHRTIGAE